VAQARRAMPATRSVLGAPVSRGHLPLVTLITIGLCVVAFVAQMATGGTSVERGRATLELVFIPAKCLDQPWRLLSGAILHGSVLHLVLNMYALWVVGSFLEQLLGRWRLAALLVLSALGGHVGVLVSTAITGDAWLTATLGASGAVFGLFAASLVLGRRLGGNMSGIAFVIGINLVFSFAVPGVSWQGHVGGLVVGGALAAVIAYAPKARRFALTVAATAGLAVILLGVVVVLMRGNPFPGITLIQRTTSQTLVSPLTQVAQTSPGLWITPPEAVTLSTMAGDR
jgi:membrane associated rhomboid family serine protease